MNTEANR